MTENEWLSVLKKEQQGMYKSLPNDIYHSRSCPGISSTKLALISESYGKYLHALDHQKTSDEMRFGSAFHDRILLPDIYHDQYAIAPDCNKRTKEGKETYQKFIDENIGKTIIEQEDYDKIELMRNKLMSINAVNYLFSSGEPETSFFWVDKETGIRCKCRADWYRLQPTPIIIDLKTSKASDRRSFSKTIYERKYQLSAAFYCDGISQVLGLEIKNFVFVVIEKEPPFEVGLYVIGPRSLEVGREMYRSALATYKKHLDNPELHEQQIKNLELETIEMPEWALKE